MPSADHSSLLLLDTHCWLWMEFGLLNEFSPVGLSALEEATSRNALLVSVISVWEVGMLESKRRIHLRLPCEEWVKKALANPAVRLAPLSPEIALESTRLPGGLRGDPADQMLVATARRMGARLLTRDKKLIEYGRRGHVSVVPA
jgi:PIN domain nuclease of toxin-antitoxin system